MRPEASVTGTRELCAIALEGLLELLAVAADDRVQSAQHPQPVEGPGLGDALLEGEQPGEVDDRRDRVELEVEPVAVLALLLDDDAVHETEGRRVLHELVRQKTEEGRRAPDRGAERRLERAVDDALGGAQRGGHPSQFRQAQAWHHSDFQNHARWRPHADPIPEHDPE